MEDDRRRDRFANERDRSSYRDEPSRKRAREDDRPSARSKAKDDSYVIQTFKQWIISQVDDMITPDVASSGYSEYKLNERKKHVQQFFLDHKDEEWFREKYHPDDSNTQRKLRETFVRQRFFAWKKLYDTKKMQQIVFDMEHQSDVEKFMNSFIMLLEDCTIEEVSDYINDGAIVKNDAPKTVEEGEEPKAEDGQEDGELKDTKKPKTYKSVFIKTIPASISKTDLIGACKRYAGFIRVSFELIPDDKKFNRRAWVTFDDSVNIKDICWNLNNIRLKETEIGAVVHKDPLSKDRIRPIPGLAQHSSVAFRDLKMAVDCCKIRDNYLFSIDNQTKKETEAETELEDTTGVFWPEHKNPLVEAAEAFIHHYEDMYEDKIKEIENFVPTKTKKDMSDNENDEEMVEIDLIDDVFQVLDPILIYLRCVHSVDFYAQGDYSSFEDEHPCRCGSTHVRGVIPVKGVSMTKAKDFVQKFKEKTQISLLRMMKDEVTDEEAQELGFKNEEAEIEKFVETNTQHLDADKYLCPLSGKKFRGKDFVRKHIFNKHEDKLEIVKRDVLYFNNFVKDKLKAGPPEPKYETAPRRSEPRGRSPLERRSQSGTRTYGGGSYSNNGYSSRGYSSGYSRDSYRSDPKHMMSRQARDQVSSVSNGRDLIDYRDLDAPEPNDMFG